MEKDPDLQKFASGTRPFESPSKPTLQEVLTDLERKRRLRPYRRTQAQMDAAKKVSDRMMGERDD